MNSDRPRETLRLMQLCSPMLPVGAYAYSQGLEFAVSTDWIKDENTTELLSIIFDRLYCLRNQLFHGGATYESKVNRDQIHDAMGILLDLVPVIIELMFKKENWGNIYYPNQKV